MELGLLPALGDGIASLRRAGQASRLVDGYLVPYARAFEHGRDAGQRAFTRYADAARFAHEVGLGINAGHDLDLSNLAVFRELPFLDEVSIGHAIISRAVFVGLRTVVREYLEVLAAASGGAGV